MVINIFMNVRLFRFFGIFLAIMFLVGSGYFIWNRFFDESARANRFLNEQVEIYEKAEKAYVEAMTADTYGGKTPQETLDMFVDALKKGDVELASKYFLLDTDSSKENSENYLTRNKYLLALRESYKNNQLSKIIDVLSRAILNPDQPSWDKNLSWYMALDNNGSLEADIALRFNKYSGIWKIESL